MNDPKLTEEQINNIITGLLESDIEQMLQDTPLFIPDGTAE